MSLRTRIAREEASNLSELINTKALWWDTYVLALTEPEH